jgi:stearoyl-CoA desaturase (Delta-9 desaturase)
MDAYLSKKWVMSAHKFKTKQRLHFVISVFIPTIFTVAGMLFLPAAAFSWFGLGLLVLMWILVGGFGVSVGFHRHFAHRSFSCSDITRFMLGAFGSMAGQGSVIYWTSIHRRHHSFADRVGDPHSPLTISNEGKSPFGAFFKGHIGWVYGHDVPMPSRYAKDLLADPISTRLSKGYWLFFVVGILAPSFAGYFYWGTIGFVYGAFWGGIVRIAIGHHVIWSINSICHLAGSKDSKTNDFSANVWWLALISFGESWHSNHHVSPTAARFSNRCFEIDLGWLLIQAIRVIDHKLKIRTDTSS